MFEQFTDDARRTVVLAQEEARLLKHNYIGTEHLLLALAREGQGRAHDALRATGVSRDQVADQVREMIGEGGSPPEVHIPFTPRSKKVLELSLRETMKLKDHEIRPEHILLGLLTEGEGVAVQILVRLGADRSKIRAIAEGRTFAGPVSEPGMASRSPRPSPGGSTGPQCLRCGSELENTIRVRAVDVPGEEGAEGVSVRLLYCGVCGAVVSSLPSE